MARKYTLACDRCGRSGGDTDRPAIPPDWVQVTVSRAGHGTIREICPECARELNEFLTVPSARVVYGE